MKSAPKRGYPLFLTGKSNALGVAMPSRLRELPKVHYMHDWVSRIVIKCTFGRSPGRPWGATPSAVNLVGFWRGGPLITYYSSHLFKLPIGKIACQSVIQLVACQSVFKKNMDRVDVGVFLRFLGRPLSIDSPGLSFLFIVH